MRIRNLALATAALSLAASPVIAQASMERAVAPVEDENELASGSGVLVGLLAAAAVVGAILIISDSDDDDDDNAVSP
ncbi:MAG: hypothetical protein WA985_01985 [Erythrobacter sp.]|uniref:hypothetical protein n=1 Tax=Erythrobacter sp. TaxID=1042 RepID=UPI003C79187A